METIKNFEDFEIIKEGTWNLPKNEKEIKKVKEYKAQLMLLINNIDEILGDDNLSDNFDGAIKRIDELIKEAPNGRDWNK